MAVENLFAAQRKPTLKAKSLGTYSPTRFSGIRPKNTADIKHEKTAMMRDQDGFKKLFINIFKSERWRLVMILKRLRCPHKALIPS